MKKIIFTTIILILSLNSFAFENETLKSSDDSKETLLVQTENSNDLFLRPSSKITTRNSSINLTPSKAGGSILALIAPDYSKNSAQMRYFSNGSSDMYIASYNHTFGYNTKKYGNFDLSVEAGKYGGSTLNDAYFVKPTLNWKYESDNFNLYFDYHGPALTKPINTNNSPITDIN